MPQILSVSFVMAALSAWVSPLSAQAEASTFELRITNESSAALTFRLHDGQSKHTKLTYNDKSVSSHKIASGTSATVGIKATGDKCSPNCGACDPSIGKVYAYYKDEKGDEQRNNYYEATLEFFEYCGISATKPVTTYTSNWTFDHGGGKGTNKYSHTQKSSHNSYTSSDPAKGLTVDKKYVSGHATITYTD
ncbi:MAG: hypothetical protein AAGJ84_01645 [Pseudomonadota bacterium]